MVKEFNYIPRFDREIDFTKEVHVYRNLRDNMLSIVQGGLVRGYVKTITLEHVRFTICQGRYEVCVATKTKNVHARVHGYISECEIVDGTRINYNPFIAPSFYIDAPYRERGILERIESAKAIEVNANGYMVATLN